MAHPPRHRKDEIVRLVKKHGYSGKKIMAATGWNRGVLRHRLAFWGIRLTPALHLHSDDEIRQAIDHCGSLSELAGYLNVNMGQLKDNLAARGLQSGYAKTKRRMADIPTPVLMRIYQENNWSVRKTAEQLGFNPKTAHLDFKRRGIQTSNGRSRYPWDHYELHQLHVVQGYSTWAIAELYGATDRGVRVAMERFGITLVNNHRNGRVPTERPARPLTDEAWDATPEEHGQRD